jgi:hypothetical protein
MPGLSGFVSMVISFLQPLGVFLSDCTCPTLDKPVERIQMHSHNEQADRRLSVLAASVVEYPPVVNRAIFETSKEVGLLKGQDEPRRNYARGPRDCATPLRREAEAIGIDVAFADCCISQKRGRLPS